MNIITVKIIVSTAVAIRDLFFNIDNCLRSYINDWGFAPNHMIFLGINHVLIVRKKSYRGEPSSRRRTKEEGIKRTGSLSLFFLGTVKGGHWRADLFIAEFL